MDSVDEDLIRSSCKIDDIGPLKDILTRCKNETRPEILSEALYYSIATSALSVLNFTLEAGADISDITPNQVVRHGKVTSVNKDLVLLLQSHGWNINSQMRPGGLPLLWMLADNPDLVRWGVQQGAKLNMESVHAFIGGDLGRTNRQVTLLEMVLTSGGGLDLFKELRQQGAPLKTICLHIAAQIACGSETEQSAQQDIQILRYLLKEEKMNANAMDVTPEEYSEYNDDYLGTPLAYCISTSNEGIDALKLLLEHGADPSIEPKSRVDESGKGPFPWVSPWSMAQTREDVHTATFIKTIENFAREHREGIAERWAKQLGL